MSKNQLNVQIAGLSDTGLVRQINEDYIGFDKGLGLAVLADGIGGHKSGELASRIAVYTLLDNLRERLESDAGNDEQEFRIEELFDEAFDLGNSLIFQAAELRKGHKGMGTTLVAAIVLGQRLHAAHVGDSRLYLCRDDKLQRLTRDHSVAQDLLDKGDFTPQQIRNFKIGHILTRAMGIGESVEVDMLQYDVKHGDIFMLCSDGLWDMLEEWRIQEVLRDANADLDTAIQTLVRDANGKGGKDNISVVLIRVQKS